MKLFMLLAIHTLLGCAYFPISESSYTADTKSGEVIERTRSSFYENVVGFNHTLTQSIQTFKGKMVITTVELFILLLGSENYYGKLR